MQRLNIPIEPNKTRQKHWRVVWMVLTMLLAIFVSFTLVRLVTTRDTTTGIRPAETTHSVRIQKTAKTTRIISSHLGSEQLLKDSPWTVNDFINEANREITLHFKANQLLGVSLDTKLSDKWQETASIFNYQVINEGNRSLVSYKGSETTFNAVNYSFRRVSPLSNGEITTHQEESRAQPLKITDQGITITNSVRTAIGPVNTFLPDGSIVHTRFQLPPKSQELTKISLYLAGINDSRLINSVNDHGAQITIGTDARGEFHSLSIPDSTLTIEELAALGTELINRKSLSTTAWTMVDGDTVQEIKVNQDDITSTINSNNDFSFISLKNSRGDQVRIIKTPEQVNISDRDISTTISQFSPVSSCLRDAHSFFQPGAINKTLQQVETHTSIFEQMFSSINYFSEVAISNKKVRFCW